MGNEEAGLHRIASFALEAMLYEVSATPKPGLVDRANCGAHRDMDFFTFMSSTAALHSAFDAMTRAGASFRDSTSPRAMWPELRRAGREAEARMFEATHGVNTHKGEIFSLGLLCGCAGWQFGKGPLNADALAPLAAEMCRGLCGEELARLRDPAGSPLRGDARPLTKGERTYLQYGCTGIRGEAESGFRTVRQISLPVFRRLMLMIEAQEDRPLLPLPAKTPSVNDALVQTLLHLIAETADTNILSRHNAEAAEYARARAREVIAAGGVLTQEGREALEVMDQDFIARYISPGGCSDLLAVTYFLFVLERWDREREAEK
ncbi:MAG: triphosphoribosyl-dephospho-CoA synthase [Fretibacterium sp.]|nr:triphosphoribosyl-dephospho-CoA synthase [Fretibacterium sp.]